MIAPNSPTQKLHNKRSKSDAQEDSCKKRNFAFKQQRSATVRQNSPINNEQ